MIAVGRKERQGNGGRKEKGQAKNIYETHMNMDNGEGIDCGLEGWAGWRRQNGDNYNRINNKNKNNKINK